jgi:hypothetical protein
MRNYSLVAPALCVAFSAFGQNVGIGTNTPNGRLQFNNHINNRIVVLNESNNNEHNFFGFGINNFILRYQIADPSQSHVFFAGNAPNATGSNELFRIRGDGNVGIAQSNPNAPLQFANDIRNRKLVLFEVDNNDHQFYGFGVNSSLLRYQTASLGDDHVFMAASGTASSNELMRIKGNGNVGIGTSEPRSYGDNGRVLQIESSGNGYNLGSSFVFSFNSAGTNYGNIGAINFVHSNAIAVDKRVGVIQSALETDPFFGSLDAPKGRLDFYVADGAGPINALAINSRGNVGIGNNRPRAPLQFANDIRNRKIVLYSTADNDHQFYGFGVNGGSLRYQTDALGADHVFFAGSGFFTSNELFRIRGNGNVGINQSNPQVPLHFANTLGKKISLFRGPQGDAGFGVFGNELRIHSDYNDADITFGYDDFTTGYVERFRMRGNGALMVAGNAGQPGQVLVSNGIAASPSWASPPGQYFQVFQTAEIGNTPLNIRELVPGLQTTIDLARASTVVLHIRLQQHVLPCFACTKNSSRIVLEKVLSSQSVQNVASFSNTTLVPSLLSFYSGPIIVNLPAGTHVFRVAYFNQGEGNNTIRNVSEGGNPGVLAWQIFPN